MVLLGAYAVARRMRSVETHVLPAGFEATAGAAMYAAAAAYLLATSLNIVIVSETTSGVGQWLSGGVVSAAVATAYGFVLYRTLLRRASQSVG